MSDATYIATAIVFWLIVILWLVNCFSLGIFALPGHGKFDYISSDALAKMNIDGRLVKSEKDTGKCGGCDLHVPAHDATLYIRTKGRSGRGGANRCASCGTYNVIYSNGWRKYWGENDTFNPYVDAMEAGGVGAAAAYAKFSSGGAK